MLAAAERIGRTRGRRAHRPRGAELLAGVVQDPVFGPLVALGPGGVFAELIGEAAFRLAPLTDVDAEELVATGKAGRLVRGFRGAEPADTAVLVDLVHRLAAAGHDHPRSRSSTSTGHLASRRLPSRSTPASASAGRCSSGARRAGSGES